MSHRGNDRRTKRQRMEDLVDDFFLIFFSVGLLAVFVLSLIAGLAQRRH